jgi:HNH endonuclease
MTGWPYEVSSLGEIIGPSGKVLKPGTASGYHCVTLCRPGERRNFLVHTLVLETFIGPKPNGMEARHLNGNRLDNRLENLCWGSKAENARDRDGHKTTAIGIRHGLAKLTDELVAEARRLNATGIGSDRLATRFGVSRPTMWDAISRKTWRHVP